MKVKSVLSLAAALMFSSLALAKMPFSNQIFGKMESTLDYCAQIDPPAGQKYQAKKKDLVKGVPEAEVTEARESDEYKNAYKEMSEQLPTVPRDDVKQVCSSALQSNK